MCADYRNEGGLAKKELWLSELKKHLPDYEFKNVILYLCQCHFRPEDLFVEKNVLKVKNGCVPDVATSTLNLRIHALEEERDALLAEVKTLKNLLTAEQFEEYTNTPVIKLKKKVPKHKLPDDDSRDEEPDADVSPSTAPPPEKVQHIIPFRPSSSS